MSPEKGPLKKDMNHLPTIIFPGDILLGGGFKYVFFIFTLILGEDEPILTCGIFCRWAVQPPTRGEFSVGGNYDRFIQIR